MKRQAFTLVELVVVILILGILAGVAAPRFLDTSGDATDAAVRQSLSVVRDAIELFTAQTGNLPGHNGNASGAGSLNDNLAAYLRGGIPDCPVGTGDNTVAPANMADDSDSVGSTPAISGWIYNTTTGTFICGFAGATSGDATVNYDDL